MLACLHALRIWPLRSRLVHPGSRIEGCRYFLTNTICQYNSLRVGIAVVLRIHVEIASAVNLAWKCATSGRPRSARRMQCAAEGQAASQGRGRARCACKHKWEGPVSSRNLCAKSSTWVRPANHDYLHRVGSTCLTFHPFAENLQVQAPWTMNAPDQSHSEVLRNDNQLAKLQRLPILASPNETVSAWFITSSAT